MRIIPCPKVTVVDAEYAPIILRKDSSSALHSEGKNHLVTDVHSTCGITVQLTVTKHFNDRRLRQSHLYSNSV